MIKMTAEVKNEEFIYSYEIGSSKYTSHVPLSAGLMVAFTDLLKLCEDITRYEDKKAADKFRAEMLCQSIVDKGEKNE